MLHWLLPSNAQCNGNSVHAYAQNILQQRCQVVRVHNTSIVMSSATKPLSRVLCEVILCIHFTRSIATERMQCLPRRLCFTRRCLIVYLSLWNLVKTTDHIFMKILPNMYLWTRKIHLNVRSHLRLNHEDSTTEKLQHRTAQCTSHIPLSPWSGAIYNWWRHRLS